MKKIGKMDVPPSAPPVQQPKANPLAKWCVKARVDAASSGIPLPKLEVKVEKEEPSAAESDAEPTEPPPEESCYSCQGNDCCRLGSNSSEEPSPGCYSSDSTSRDGHDCCRLGSTSRLRRPG